MAIVISPSKSDNWGTPNEFFLKLDYEFDFTLDPCANRKRSLKPTIKEYYIEDNGLEKSWKDHRVFANPPFTKSQIKDWAQKCFVQRNQAELIVLLMPAHTDRSWFHKYINGVAEIRFIRGRLRFWDIDNNKKGTSSQHAIILCIYRRETNG